MKRLLIPFLALIVAILACGPLGGGEPSDDEAIDPFDEAEDSDEAPADEGAEEPAESSDGAGDSDAASTYLFSGLGLDDHNSFSFEFQGRITPAEEGASDEESAFSGSMTVQRDPELATWVFFADLPEGSGDASIQTGAGAITGYLVEGVLYSVIEVNGEETCVGIPETGDTLGDTMGIFMGPDSFNDPKYHSEELTLVESGVEVNGFMTDHYRGENVNNEDFESGTVDLWVIQGEDIPARMTLLGQTEDETYGLVTVEWTYDLVGLDQAVEVTIPDNCSVVGGDS